jgi:hypothetical protein
MKKLAKATEFSNMNKQICQAPTAVPNATMAMVTF